MTFISVLGTARDPGNNGKSAKLVIQELLGKGTGVNHAYGSMEMFIPEFLLFSCSL